MPKIDTPDTLSGLGFFKGKVVDIGCGVAPIADWIDKNGGDVSYYGLDVCEAKIIDCKTRFRNNPFFTFRYLPVYNKLYNPYGIIDAENISISIPSNQVDSIICHSLFTHLSSFSAAISYMNEIKRLLKPGGLLWTTWFSSPPNPVSHSEVRTVYPLDFIKTLLHDFHTIYESGGQTNAYNDQWEIASTK